jgi:hypothetical protein
MRATLLKPVRIGRPVVAAALVALVLASCGPDNEKAVTPTTTTAAPSSTTDPSASEDAAVLDGYRGYWSAYLKAADPMDPQSPVLQEHATGPALETVVKAFVGLKSAGKVIRGQFDLAPRVINVDGETASVRDCYVDDTGVFDVATGARDDEPTGQRHQVTATLRLQDGTWKVERLAEEGLGCTAA